MLRICTVFLSDAGIMEIFSKKNLFEIKTIIYIVRINLELLRESTSI